MQHFWEVVFHLEAKYAKFNGEFGIIQKPRLMPLAAITFDIWETILADASDEPKRAGQDLGSKAEVRRQLFWETLSRHVAADKAVTDAAFDMHEAAFRKVWHSMAVTWEVPDRLDILFDGFGVTLPPDERDALIARFESMELEVKPDIIDGAANVIAELADRFKLCIISDTIYTPGYNLREILDHHGVKRHFQGFVFSDEVGRSKPHARCFESAAEQLGLPLPEIVHIGDREAKDIAGAKAAGMKAILFTGARDEGSAETTGADAVVSCYSDLIDAVTGLA